MKMKTPNLADSNFATLAAMFPNAVTETITGYDENGKPIIERAIDADVLAQEINTRVVSGKEERYQFTWPDKKKSTLLANASIAASLRPVRGDEPAVMKDGDKEIKYTRTGSVNFDDTENLYIEGDNLDVLKLLRETYLNRVKMIYIDPPYNTGKDFIYEDNFTGEIGEFLRRDGQYDEQGNRLILSLDSNGRFHTDWLNMMYPRLRMVKDLLTDDGVIFISIDDNEQANLRKVCDEIFGKGNLLINGVWISGRTSSAHFTNSHEYVIGYAKNKYMLPLFAYTGDGASISDRTIKKPGAKNPISSIEFPAGIEFECEDKVFPLEFGGSEPVRIIKGNMICENRKLKEQITIEAAWAMRDMIISWLKGEKVIDQKGQVVKRFFFKSNGILQYEKEKGTIHPNSVITGITTKSGTNELNELLGKDFFDFPKPTELVKYFGPACNNINEDAVILDFFSGSATTAHAVMQLNAEDGGKRKFIMVQLPEICPEDSEAYKAGYKNICEIGKERIRRAGKKIIAENKDKPGIENLDIGFRVLKLDSSNMKEVYYTPEKYAQLNFDLEGFMDNIKPDRTEEDLLFQVMLDLGIPLSAKITREGNILYVNDNYLIACFGKVDTALITEIAKKKPYYAVFRDSSFSDDSAMINFEQVFSTYSPTTIRRVL
jgi:adenine-specific DNA-methyltransferase